MNDLEEIPYLDWNQFLEEWKWNQGEHVTLIGPTGTGKSTLMKAIEYKRSTAVVLVTKKKDPIVDAYKRIGYKLIKTWEDVPTDIYPKVILKPPFDKGDDKERTQRIEFKYAFDRAFEYGGVALYIEELQYMDQDLGLARQMNRLWQQGRSLGVTMIAGTQRPRNVPLAAFSQATHIFFFNSSDDYDIQRIGSMGGVNNRTIREAVNLLDSHQVLYLNTRTREMVITKVRK